MVREEGLDTLGKTIRYYRKKAGYTQESFGELVYLNKITISDIENDKNSITIDRLILFAEVLGIHPAKLLGFWDYSIENQKKEKLSLIMKELNKIEDMELVGMVLNFVLMLENSSFNHQKAM